ncbi:MAG: molybdopterin-guanine dinucleotide biosynthesis protein MobB [Proteobacteria bacterium]|nr:molybdopterin-guanine dinucleotide biosynthesis protein MobB [Pseudomonadota bacterium]MDA1356863.1 molybdopterin-guanine dinucleotide biosynthesis protein MobB [Pseudomonadota bacterium]
MTLIGIRGGGDNEQADLARLLLGELKARGQSVSVLAYAGASADIDIPGKDSYEHRRAGAREVLAVSRLRWALVHEAAEADTYTRPALDELLIRLVPVDFVLALGISEDTGITLDLADGNGSVQTTHDGGPAKVFRLDRTAQIADFIVNSPVEKHPIP